MEDRTISILLVLAASAFISLFVLMFLDLISDHILGLHTSPIIRIIVPSITFITTSAIGCIRMHDRS